jgi:hypothetical protein
MAQTVFKAGLAVLVASVAFVAASQTDNDNVVIRRGIRQR